jgi:hypothetical protein
MKDDPFDSPMAREARELDKLYRNPLADAISPAMAEMLKEQRELQERMTMHQAPFETGMERMFRDLEKRENEFARHALGVGAVGDQIARREAARLERLERDFAVPAWLRDVHDIHRRYELDYEHLTDPYRKMAERAKRFAEALAMVQNKLPTRGWYMCGEGGCGTHDRVAEALEKGDWETVDRLMLEEAKQLRLDADNIAKWLAEHGVPDYCINRLRRFLEHWDAGNHEDATVFGVPLIDELSRWFYDGKDFTTKRKKQPRPELGVTTPGKPPRLSTFCRGFVADFGLIHGDVDPTSLEDENYFNRAAILHGRMRRSYGPKDSAKTFMVILFLVFALDDEPETDDEPNAETDSEAQSD